MVKQARCEQWCGHNIRFVEVDGEWRAILKDICDALHLKVKDVSQRLNPWNIESVLIDITDLKSVKTTSNRGRGDRKTMWMLTVDENGIYQALFASRKLEARKFTNWAGTVLTKLRKRVGLEGYEVMRMTETVIQDEIDYILDTLYWDEERKCVMQSVTVQGGDVEQIPFE